MLIHDTNIWRLHGGDRRKLPIVREQRVPVRVLPKQNKQDVRGAEAAGAGGAAGACRRVSAWLLRGEGGTKGGRLPAGRQLG